MKVAAFRERLGLLRTYERTTYSLCRFLLESEADAVRAAKGALIDLFSSEAFAAADTEAERVRLIRSIAARRCLQLRRNRKRDVE